MYAPWHIYLKKLEMLFLEDEEVDVGNYTVTDGIVRVDILCHTIEKFVALKEVLKNFILVGSSEISRKRIILNFIYDGTSSESYDETFRKAFEGNPYFKEIVKNSEHEELTYAVFRKEVISFFSENIGDYAGNTHELVEDVVSEVTHLVNNDEAVRIVPCSEQ